MNKCSMICMPFQVCLLKRSLLTNFTFKVLISFMDCTDATCFFYLENICSYKNHIWMAFFLHEQMKHVHLSDVLEKSYNLKRHIWMAFFLQWTDATFVFKLLFWEKLKSQITHLNGSFLHELLKCAVLTYLLVWNETYKFHIWMIYFLHGLICTICDFKLNFWEQFFHSILEG